jgi:parvulin-like peptidyl-prolyl isomerase
MLRRLVREPLLHFLVLGVALFALYGRLGGDASDAPDEIVLDRARLEGLAAQFERVWQRTPTPVEREALVETWLREEILYREGVAMGLDRDDPVVRRRIAQKMDFLADTGAPTQPSDADLQAWLDAHPGDYRIEPVYTLRQLYFDPGRRGERLAADLDAARAALARGATVAGDPSLLPQELDTAPASEVARTFGRQFAAALDALPVGSWQGPLPSGYGLHLVELRARTPGRPAMLEEVRAALVRDWRRDRSEAASRAFYEALRQRYTVRMEDDARAGDARASAR